jgi:2-(1,2-epoxy-1,2-dihydrophenyl)acetyl-CoA isomerase
MSGYHIDRREGVATLSFDRPAAGNAISPEMVAGLTTFFEAARSDPGVRCIIVRGEGKHFSAGGDLAAFAQAIAFGPEALRAQFDTRLAAAGRLAKAVIDFDRPIVACVRGGVAGAGLLFVLAADLVVADESAFLLFSHQRVGLPPDCGVSWLLPRVVGSREASRLILTAARIEASEALRLGLVSRLVPSADLEPEVDKLAHRLAGAPQAAMRSAKVLLRRSSSTSLADQLDDERAGIVACVGDPDFTEGVQAFMEKRAAVFPSTLLVASAASEGG